MQENYHTFPSFITAENMQTITSETDIKLYDIRRQITYELTKITQTIIYNTIPRGQVGPKAVHIKIQNGLNYKQIKILNDELTERGFRVEYTVLDKKGGQIYCKFVDIDGYGDMPVHMIIHWK